MTVSKRQVDHAAKRDRTDEELQEDIRLAERLRPRKRSECCSNKGPCPWVSCRFHLFLDVNPANGAIKMNFPGLEVWQLPVSCALNVAEQGGLTLEEVGHLTNLTRERVRQAVGAATRRLRSLVCGFTMDADDLDEFLAAEDD